MERKIKHFLYVPFTGLGLFGGHRGKRWLRNRIKIFKQFVVPSLLNQTNRDFTLWISWRQEDRGDKDILALKEYLGKIGLKNVLTYSGVAFWDDKYSDEVARERLLGAIHGSTGELINEMNDCTQVYMTIQPSDDLYCHDMIEEVHQFFKENPHMDVFGYKKGYVMDYINWKIAEWNPTSTPPFYTIKFPREVFIDPLKHISFTGPYKSHEFLKDYMRTEYIDKRGFLVGTHGENISTIFNHPFAGEINNESPSAILTRFGIDMVTPLKIKTSIRRIIMRKLPYGWQRKLRYWIGERFYSRFYNWIRG